MTHGHLPPSKGYLKTHFEFSFVISTNFIYSNSPQQLIEKMSQTNPSLLPTSKMDLAVTILKAPLYLPSLPYCLGDSQIYHLLTTLLLSVKSPALAIILLSLLCLFACKPGKICSHNSIDSFLITSSSVVCSEFNHSLFSIMVRVKQIIFNYFKNNI